MTTITSTWIRCDVCHADEGHAERSSGRPTSAARSLEEFLERGGIRHPSHGDTPKTDECADCKTRRLSLGDPDHPHAWNFEPSGRGIGFDDVCECGALRYPLPVL